MKVTISRLFDDVIDAQRAMLRLEHEGVARSDINLIANNSDKWFAPAYGSAALKGAVLGAGFGGVGGALAGFGLLLIPGLETIAELGWVAASATCAAAVAAVGGLIAVLAEAGIAANQAEICAKSIRRGGSLVSARVEKADRHRLAAILDPTSAKGRAKGAPKPADQPRQPA